ncbi:hypothetical protein PLEOSDRAFT_1102260 [Pleurotus ostreatus PC15]|uniref:Uncharacterized protein n=1 Tax=Pleurotus ostreatus (strain PC15) TaxID=1137138 RepID=A0A067P4G7_PLEO1|nr:hypothetical protein PLEOSDRAFT_1102260 [Pleurotus ostreatus PC15]
MEKRLTTRRSQCSLVISPNLDAMLEYNEKVRRSKGLARAASVGAVVSTITKTSPVASGTEGLPPPPRKPRWPRSPTLSERDEIKHEEDATDPDLEPHRNSNPYINPIPCFELGSLVEDQPAYSTTAVDGSHADSSPWGEVSSRRGHGAEGGSPSGSPGDVRSSQDHDLKQPSSATEASSQPPSPLSTFAKVDNLNKLFGKSLIKSKSESKNHAPSRPSTSSGTERAEVTSKLARGLILAARGKFTAASKNKNVIGATGMGQHETPILDIRRVDDAGFGHRVGGGGPARALYLSHDSPSSAPSASLYSDEDSPSRSSLYDHHDDHRISISSTIYPSSSSHIHPARLTPLLLPPDRMSSLRNLMSGHRSAVSLDHDVERESFIDLVSPPAQVGSFPPNDPRTDPKPTSRPSTPTAHLRSSSEEGNAQPSPSSYSMFAKKPRGRSRSPKPPIPNTPKPIFNRPTTPLGISTLLSASPKPSPAPSPLDTRSISDSLPSTTNLLNPEERAERIRKSQKLAQVFGQTPGPDVLNQQCVNLQGQSLKQRVQHSRGSASVSVGKEPSKPAWPPPEGTQYITARGRRHSNPLVPEDVSFLDDDSLNQDSVDDLDDSNKDHHSDHAIEIGTEEGVPSSDWDGRIHQNTQDQKIRPDSPTSFIDLSDADDTLDNEGTSASIIGPDPISGDSISGRRRTRALSAALSLYENMSPEEQAEEERRRKREKLAKLHRFLGSRVPANLALGLPGDPSDSLPPLTFATNPDLDIDTKLDSPMLLPTDDLSRKMWLRRRRSSSAAALPTSWSDDIDRVKEDLNDREKSINVKRAQKMERLFGVAPPQTLYHTRHAPSPSLPVGPARTFALNTPPESPVVPNLKSNNQFSTTAATKSGSFPYPKPKLRKSERPGTSESSKLLLPSKGGSISEEPQSRSPPSAINPVLLRSNVYSHYQHSLNSLNDIIDRDDKESLAELHEYLHSADDDATSSPGPSPTTLQEFARSPLPLNRKLSTASIKSERRRSLPARTSLATISTDFSAASDYFPSSTGLHNRASLISITTPKPEITDFQLRRRRAAKLTQFFGVNYRELIHDILESIEKGLEDERKRGTLQPDEVEDLLQKLRTLRTKRGKIF